MIIGTGIDLVELYRIENLIHNKKFIERILTDNEQKTFYSKTSEKRKIEFLAGRFSAKEAYAKATGLGIGEKLSWQDIEVFNEKNGRPGLRVQSTYQVHLSITHTEKYAAAMVTIESLSG